MKVLKEKIGWKKVQYLDPGLQGGDVINIAQLRRHAPRSLLRHSLATNLYEFNFKHNQVPFISFPFLISTI